MISSRRRDSLQLMEPGGGELKAHHDCKNRDGSLGGNGQSRRCCQLSSHLEKEIPPQHPIALICPYARDLMSEMQNIFVYINCIVTAQNWFPLNTLIKASNSIRNLHANSKNNVMLNFKFIFISKSNIFYFIFVEENMLEIRFQY